MFCTTQKNDHAGQKFVMLFGQVRSMLNAEATHITTLLEKFIIKDSNETTALQQFLGRDK